MIKEFKDLFTDYETYSNKDFLMNRVSASLLNQVANVFVKGVRNKVQNYAGEGIPDLEKSLQELCNIVCMYTGLKETTSWGEYFIIEDYQAAFQRFASRPFPKFMDALSKITLEFLEGKVIPDLNEALADNNFGYRIQNDFSLPWISINPRIRPTPGIDKAAEIAAAAAEAVKFMREKKEQLANPHLTVKGREAVQECLSAMEAFILKTLKAEDPQDQNDTDLTSEQADDYIDRMIAYVNYLEKAARNC